MSATVTGSAPSAVEILNALREQVPEIEREQRWPVTIVFDAFAIHVADRVRAGARNEELEPYFALVEELAESRDPVAESLVIVDFLEVAPWTLLGAGHLFGPATTRLSMAGDADQPAATPMTTSLGGLHAQMLERFPALGELVFDELLSELAQLGWEAHVYDRPDLVRHVMGFAEWLAAHERDDLAERAISPLFGLATGIEAGAGQRTAELLRRR